MSILTIKTIWSKQLCDGEALEITEDKDDKWGTVRNVWLRHTDSEKNDLLYSLSNNLNPVLAFRDGYLSGRGLL